MSGVPRISAASALASATAACEALYILFMY